MQTIKLYLRLDVHKDSLTIAIAEPGPQGEIRLWGTLTNDLHALEKALSHIRKAHPGASLEVAYEAGPCGIGIARRLQQLQVPCRVAAHLGIRFRHPSSLDRRLRLTRCAGDGP